MDGRKKYAMMIMNELHQPGDRPYPAGHLRHQGPTHPHGAQSGGSKQGGGASPTREFGTIGCAKPLESWPGRCTTRRGTDSRFCYVVCPRISWRPR